MKSKKKIVIISTIILAILIAIGASLLIYFKNPNKLTATERRFLADQANTVQNINVLNNVDVFGDSGVGLYYDFLDDFSKEYGLDVNSVAYNLGDNPSGVTLGVANSLNDNDIAFYKDHYILVSKSYEYINNLAALNSKKIGVLHNDMSYVTSYLNDLSLSLTSYDNSEALSEAFKTQEDIQYIIVPMHLYLKTILSNNYAISYHFSDMFYYYKMTTSQDTLGSILKKYYNDWAKNNMNEYYEDHLFQLFINSLGISSTEVDAMQSVTYNYGFIDNEPYEILSGGNYGGIIAQYLKEFMEFSDTEIEFTKYKKVSQLTRAINNQKIDLYFGYYNLSNPYDSISSGIGLSYSVLLPKKDSTVINSLKSLEKEEIYVENESELYNYLKNNTKLNLNTYKNKNFTEIPYVSKYSNIFYYRGSSFFI